MNNLNDKATTVQIIAARGIVVHNNSILLTSKHGDAWSIPGGWVDHLEPSSSACIREIHEETGLHVTINEMVYMSEYIATKQNKYGNTIHKFELFFVCDLKPNQDMTIIDRWHDHDNDEVQYRKFFNNDEWQNKMNIQAPEQLKAMNLIDIKNYCGVIGALYR